MINRKRAQALRQLWGRVNASTRGVFGCSGAGRSRCDHWWLPQRAPASISHAVSGYRAVPLLCAIGLFFRPAAVAVSRGYRRERIGIGPEESRAATLAGSVLVAGCALPAGFLAHPEWALSPDLGMASPAFCSTQLVVIGTPIAVVLSLLARIFARQLLRRLQ